MTTLTAYFVSIVIAGVPVSEVGPFADPISCEMMMEEIIEDYEYSFENNYPEGYDATEWGVPRIVQMEDHEFSCESQTFTIGEDVGG